MPSDPCKEGKAPQRLTKAHRQSPGEEARSCSKTRLLLCPILAGVEKLRGLDIGHRLELWAPILILLFLVCSKFEVCHSLYMVYIYIYMSIWSNVLILRIPDSRVQSMWGRSWLVNTDSEAPWRARTPTAATAKSIPPGPFYLALTGPYSTFIWPFL